MKKKENAFLSILKCIALFIVLIILSYVLATLPAFRGKNLRVTYNKDEAVAMVMDDKGLFDSKQIKELNNTLKSCSEELEMNIIVYVSGTAIPDSQTADFAINTYNSELGKENVDGLILYLDFSIKYPAYDVLSCMGKAGIIYDNDEREKILDEVGAYLPSSDYEPEPAGIRTAIEQFCLILSTHNDKYKTSKLAFDTDKENGLYCFDTGSEFYVTKQMAPGALFIRFILSFGIGFLITVIVYFVTKKKYRFKNQTNPSVYVSSDRSTFSERSDTFIRTYTTKHKIESSSSGGGHRSGGGHSGGGFSSGRHR